MNNTSKVLCAFAASVVMVAPIQAAPFKSKKGYSIQAPAGWKIDTSGIMNTDVALLAPPRGGFAPNLNVLITPVPAGATLAQLKSQSSAMMSRMLSGYKSLGQTYTTLAGGRALQTAATFKQGTPARTLRIYQVAALRGGKAYIFTGTALASSFSTYQPAFKRAIASVKWTR